MKRLFDILASGCGLIVLSPLFLVLAIWIKLDSKGPVFYRQVRVGRGNKDFRIFKFRSMRIGADKGSLVTIGGRDPRVTGSGYYIRKYKFDELPQLINVFVGDMSLVGPRPEVRHYVDYWSPEQMRVLDVRPGITDPASIKFRNENELMENAEDPEDFYINVIMQEKIKLYLEYVDHSSFWYDIKLIFQTFKVIVTERWEGDDVLLGADGMGQEPLLVSLKGEDVAAGRRLREVKRVLLDSAAGCYGCVVPKGAWHTVEVLAPSVIYEAKDGKYGEDGSEPW